MARVAAVLALLLLPVLAACGSSGDNKPAPGPDNSKPVTVYIERGFVPSTVQNADGTLACDPRVLSSPLVQDGTVDVEGTHVTTKWDQTTVTVTFDGQAFADAVVVNGKFAATLKDSARSDGFVMKFGSDWKEAAPAKTIVLCGGGA